MEGTNTALIVILILIVLGFGAYWFIQNQSAQNNNDAGLEVKINGDNNSGY